MDYLVSIAFALLCGVLIFRMVRSRDVIDLHLGVVGLFSIGYFCLPIWFKSLSRLQFYDDWRVAQALFVFLLFALCVSCGVWISRSFVRESVAFQTPHLDSILFRHRRLLTLAAFVWYLYYYASFSVTSYTSQDFEAYFSDSGSASSIAAALANISIGWIAFNIALALRDRRIVEFWVYSGFLLTCIAMLLFVGQRLAFLSPLVMLLASFALTGQGKKAVNMLVISVLALLLVSPIAVAVRQSRQTDTAEQAVSSFSYGSTPADTILQSIIDRGDLIYVAVQMIPRIDTDSRPGVTYYTSVPITAIPSVLYPGTKPYLLSTNGQPSGELSIYAWDSILGHGTGSLSAFGGLVAYRELGWIGVILNGFATGIAFVFIQRWLGRGGMLPKVLYTGLFVALSVKKVPPSFWETLGEVMPLLPMIGLILVAEVLLSPRRPSTSPIVYGSISAGGRRE